MNRDEASLMAILREISSVPGMMKGYSMERFLKSEKTQKAICMTLLNIGELVKGISDDFKNRNPSVSWKEIAGLRDITAHLVLDWDTRYYRLMRLHFAAGVGVRAS